MHQFGSTDDAPLFDNYHSNVIPNVFKSLKPDYVNITREVV